MWEPNNLSVEVWAAMLDDDHETGLHEYSPHWPTDRERTDTWARPALNTRSFIFEEVDQAICQRFTKSMCYFPSNKQERSQS